MAGGPWDHADVTARVQLEHVPALDGVRGVAIAGVVLFHAGRLRGGYLGVDLFLVLSGFLITSLLLVESGGSGAVKLGAFWARRARRLLPALGVLLLFIVAYCVVLAQPADLAQVRGDALATLGYVANWRAVFAGQDYWALFRSPSPLNHTWSLAIEEQFYLVWPLVFVGLLAWWKRRTPRAVLVVALGLGAVSSLLMWLRYDPLDPSRAYFGTDTRAAAVLAGAALAAALAIWGPVRARTNRVLLELAGATGAAVLAIAWFSLDGHSGRLYRGGFLVCGVAAVAVIAAVTHPDRMVLGKLLSWKPLCGLGVISYGVYLWHWPVDVVVTESRAGVGGWALFAVQCACTLAIALASFALIESPVRRGAGTRRQWSIAVPVLVGVLVLGTVASTARASEPPSAEAVERRLDRAVARLRTSPLATRRVMVIGDSVGWYLGDAIAATQVPSRPLVANLSLLACMFPSGASAVTFTTTGELRPNPPSCDRNWDAGLRRFHPTVVVMFGWAEGNVKFEIAGREQRPCHPQYVARVRAQLTSVARRVTRAGARFVITTYPVTVADAESASARRAVACLNRARRDAAGVTGSQLVDLARYVCPPGRPCTTEVAGFVLRPDGVHFRGPAAVGVAQWILTQIR